ncbi:MULTISPECIES: cobaltochelatase subunit CobT [unclassified Mesorhizobium]|uniref:cobaltochelatase subunit CobT n=1 Tax=unclassified Mesorhizobium TaxID=325217 RepID=UPI000FD4CEED|nr:MULTISPECIES: cobaltochelatase subunit CobT [unclassified Mesorhizobium]RUX09551.1 cobaltochelatase subunit CobT [Mesorhizobium sp. M8A.F.Ca.ET.059.01.1.1]TGR40047.1 cobaltochelatase subunit CobT [bacterium M00.F.Ca.ET.199.01.1.1]TGU24250.1 cobaltochelatase subunit CobT [bacterium M00.F.Ca.ET.156.01.1.1]TGU97209.1 cobaltochelatase subunit CobT [Mesorhizobium sp. M00.F.Ca.ET.151.01.1.1]TGV10205.1 cobaltochelatase subunit CobT [Mesorhizobium sp. M8A.F.Ca.ET.173.01.1.1]TGV89466.1 cobaltochela
MAGPGDNTRNKSKTGSEADSFKRAVTVCMRAIAGDKEMEVGFAKDRPALAGSRARLPELPKKASKTDIAITRGLGDSMALKRACHDVRIHSKLAPEGKAARAIYDAVEQARVEAIGSRAMQGVADNIGSMLEDKYAKANLVDVKDKADAPIEEALALMVREKLTGRPVPKSGERLVELWRPWVEEKAKADLDGLSEKLEDQQAFARVVREMLASMEMAEELGDDQETEDSEDNDDNQPQGEEQSEEGGEDDSGSEQSQSEDAEASADDEQSAETEASDATADDLSDDDDADAETPGEARRNDNPFTNLPKEIDYKVYTSAFDETVGAEELCEEEELDRLRAFLDKQLANLSGVVGRLANRLQRRLMAQQNRSWDFDLEEGYLDPARLVRVVIDPMQPLSFKQERDTKFRDTVVTLVLDNSGSMRGRPITVAATCADILARTLERCGVSVEILGFTTRAWKGGQAREKWLKDGKPPNPGRLNDLRHIIYKSADHPWRRARRNLGLMMREGLLKENIDGEALLWAHNRLIARPEQRKILMMISDGAPVDDSTLSVNPGNYLERHLRAVIELIETRSPVELLAIGIGHDVTRYYRRAVTIVDAEELAGAMTEQLASLFAEESAKDTRRGGMRRAG